MSRIDRLTKETDAAVYVPIFSNLENGGLNIKFVCMNSLSDNELIYIATKQERFQDLGCIIKGTLSDKVCEALDNLTDQQKLDIIMKNNEQVETILHNINSGLS